jgi:hypothetical protein
MGPADITEAIKHAKSAKLISFVNTLVMTFLFPPANRLL